MRRWFGVLAAVAVAFASMGEVAAAQTPDARHWRLLDPENTLYIDTTRQRIVVEMYPEVAPQHVARIRELARAGFYDNIAFHRVIPTFMAQTGDPLCREADLSNCVGEGASSLPDLDPEFTFRRGAEMAFVRAAEQRDGLLGFIKTLPVETQPDEQMLLTRDRRVLSNAVHCEGVVSMARAQALNSANSQFFIMLGARASLDKSYSIWGRVVFGLDTVRALATGEPPANPDRMVAVRVAADLPEAERAPIYVRRTDSSQFRELIERTRRERRADFSICDVEIEAFVPRDPQRERSWWSIIPFIP